MSPHSVQGLAETEFSCGQAYADDSERFERLRQILSTFNHRCRNSLNGIKMSLYLFRRSVDGPMPSGWNELERTYREIEKSFDRLQVIYRPLTMSFVRSPLGQLIAERLPSWRSWFSAHGNSLEIERPDRDTPGDFDPIHLGLGLDAFVAWRAETGSPGSQPRLGWRVSAGSFHVTWTETPRTRELRDDCQRGSSTESANFIRGDSLAIPLFARVVAVHGGSLERTGSHAVTLTIRWPQLQGQP
jgi:hypothetical protein